MCEWKTQGSERKPTHTIKKKEKKGKGKPFPIEVNKNVRFYDSISQVVDPRGTSTFNGSYRHGKKGKLTLERDTLEPKWKLFSMNIINILNDGVVGSLVYFYWPLLPPYWIGVRPYALISKRKNPYHEDNSWELWIEKKIVNDMYPLLFSDILSQNTGYFSLQHFYNRERVINFEIFTFLFYGSQGQLPKGFLLVKYISIQEN